MTSGQVNIAMMTMMMMMMVTIRTPLLPLAHGLQLQDLRHQGLNLRVLDSRVNEGGVVGHLDHLALGTLGDVGAEAVFCPEVVPARPVLGPVTVLGSEPGQVVVV